MSGSVIFNVGNGIGDIFNTNYKQFARSINVNTWYNMICMMNVFGVNTILSIILNGVSYSTVLSNFVPSTNWLTLSGLVMNIGKRGTDNYDLTPSFLQDFRLFNTILLQDEITEKHISPVFHHGKAHFPRLSSSLIEQLTVYVNNSVVETIQNL